MSETISLEFVTRRLDAVQNDQADLRRRMIALAERFGGIEIRIGAIEGRIGGIENRMSAFEERMDLLIERMSKQEANISRALLLLERLAPPPAP
jgi:predicted  nucleic acid-binding Zn-ribbon protein